MRENLKQFIRQQAIRGENPERLREGLILNGWDSKDVDRAIKETYGLKNKISKTIITLTILLIIVFSLSLFLIFNNLYFEKETTPEPTNPEREQTNTQEQTKEISHKCELIQDIDEKETCYIRDIEQGFDCFNLTPTEEFYCNRVLENYLLTMFEQEEI